MREQLRYFMIEYSGWPLNEQAGLGGQACTATPFLSFKLFSAMNNCLIFLWILNEAWDIILPGLLFLCVEFSADCDYVTMWKAIQSRVITILFGRNHVISFLYATCIRCLLPDVILFLCVVLSSHFSNMFKFGSPKNSINLKALYPNFSCSLHKFCINNQSCMDIHTHSHDCNVGVSLVWDV